MHVLYVHQNFPAQFGHIAAHLAKRPGWKCTFVTEAAGPSVAGVERVVYKRTGGATQNTHFCSRTFENAVFNCDAVYHALKARPDLRPDLIVGHSGFGSTLFLRDLYPGVPIINLFEYYYRPDHPDSDMGYRRDLGWKTPEIYFRRARCRNAMILLDLQQCEAGYCPTEFQRSTFPELYQPRLRTIFDGIERSVYHGYGEALRPPIANRRPRNVGGVMIGPATRIVTYVSRGFESMRGFDLFMRAARIMARQNPDIIFLIAGADQGNYGGDEAYLPEGMTFKQWVLSRDAYDPERFRFLGRLPEADLGRLLALTDLHVYLTVPFVLSWSMMDAMSCGAVVLGSDTPPVREMIRDGENGILADLFDVEAIAEKARPVLRDPNAFRPLGRAAEQMITQNYSVESVLPRMSEMYEQVASGERKLDK